MHLAETVTVGALTLQQRSCETSNERSQQHERETRAQRAIDAYPIGAAVAISTRGRTVPDRSVSAMPRPVTVNTADKVARVAERESVADRESPQSLVMETFGVTVEVAGAPAQLSAVRGMFPPGATRSATGTAGNGRFALVPTGDNGLMDVLCDERSVSGAVDERMALGILDSQLRMHIALHAPDHVFIHAGVVGVGEWAIVLPGHSFAGKTTLVAALMQLGAGYWSDEFAALDANGLVHPYAKPLSVRNAEFVGERRTPGSLGGRVGDLPLRVGLIALTHYRPGGSWAPRACSAGEGAVKLLEHTIPARSRPEQALAAVRYAVTGAQILEGERGEADETAAALMAALAS
jgi:hypothetical protein